MQTSVRAHDIATLLDRAPPGVEVLSLDCFDTLIWRNTHAPTDVMAELDWQGGGIEPRMWAESQARRSVLFRTGAREVGLDDIYREMIGHGDETAIAHAIATELEIERRHAFAFAPTVALMREAKVRGLQVVIVSDMYLSELQLRAHIAAAAGQDVMDLIDHVFVSNAYGEGKCDALFGHVLKTLGVTGDKMLHVGDNHAADYVSALANGIHAVHLEQFDAETAGRLRMEAAAASLLDPTNGTTRPICQAHRAQVALRRNDDPAYRLGHDVMGPSLAAFAEWLKREIDEASAAAGRPVKPLFVMRDGHLPHQVFKTLYPEADARTVDLSRFVALRASIDDADALASYLDEWAEKLPVRSLARQLMLFGHEYAKFAKGDSEELRLAFAKWLLSNKELQGKIFARKRAFLAKLVAHMKSVGVARGDAVMLVDVGYNGSVQNIVTPILTEAMGLSISGRYICLREKRASGLDKRGMIDTRHFDYRTLQALACSVVVLEQVCTISEGSTVDFTDDGQAIRDDIDEKSKHNPTRDTIQTACLDFARDYGAGRVRAPDSDDLDSRCRAAVAIFARLFFLPTASEVRVFEEFRFDYNMGTAASDALVHRDRGRDGLRRRGLVFYNDKLPQFMSAELQAQGLPISLANFTASRFKLDLRSSDFDVGGVDVPVILAGGDGGSDGLMDFTAFPTTDGYYQLRIPIGGQRPTIAIQLGQHWEWVQVEECGFVPLADMYRGSSAATVAVRGGVDAMEEVAPNLFRAQPTGVLIVMPPAGSEPMVLSLVFRPIMDREAVVSLRAAA